MALGIHRVARQLAGNLAGEWIEQAQRLDFIVEQLHPQRLLIGFSGMDINDFAAHPERPARQFQIVAGVLQIGQPAQDSALIHLLAAHQVQDHLHVPVGIAQPVNRRHGGDDDRVGPLQNRLGRRQPHLLDVLVDRGVLLDVGVRRGNIGFRLVVVVIGDEVLHRVFGEKLLHLAVKLGRQGLVGRQHQRRTLHGGDDVGDGEGLAAAGDTEQGLMRQTGVETFHQTADGLRLVAGGLEGSMEGEGFVRLHGSLAGRQFPVLSDSHAISAFNLHRSASVQESFP